MEQKRSYMNMMCTEEQIEAKRLAAKEYMKDWRKGIRRGRDRAPRHTVEATPEDLSWAAGFFQGEGHVSSQGRSVVVSQIEREVLDRLASLFGGTVLTLKKPTKAGNTVFQWSACGANARRFAMLVGPLLMGKKQDQLYERIKLENSD